MRNRRGRRSNKISEHFSKKDFCCHCGECKNSIRISLGLVGGLELLRSKLRRRIKIVKGYECADSREKSGSFKKNYHGMGIAADIAVENMPVNKIFESAELIPEFMGIGIDVTNQTLHVDTRKGDDREVWVLEEGRSTPMTDKIRKSLIGDTNEPST